MATMQENLREWSDELRSDLSERGAEVTARAEEFIKSLPYAAVGATVHNVDRVRNAVKFTFEMPSRLVRSTKESPERIRDAYQDRVERGRRVFSRVSHRDGVAAAADRFRNVKSQTKGMTTSVSRAARAAVDAVEDAAEAAFEPQDSRPYEERTYEELRELASDRNVVGRSSMNKQQLIEALRTSQ